MHGITTHARSFMRARARSRGTASAGTSRTHVRRQVDRKGTGTITFSEFESLHVFLASVEEEFRRLRADAAGRVAVDEVVRMLVAQGACGGWGCGCGLGWRVAGGSWAC